MASTTTNLLPRPSLNSDAEDDASSRPRARVSRACARCRSRKDKCDGKHPQCSNCAGANQSCLYLPTNKKRGLPEGYVRGMEKLWAVMIQKVDGLEDTVGRVLSGNQEEILRSWNHHKHGDDLHTFWKESKVLSELEGLLSRLDQSPSTDLKRKRERDDEDNTINPASDGPPDMYRLQPEYRVVNVLEPEQQLSNGLHLPRAPSTDVRRPLPDTAPALIDHYFTYTHCWFPILNKPYTLKRFYEYRKPQRTVPPETADLAFLWALCAYSKQQTFNSPSSLSDQRKSLNQIEEWRQVAREMIPSDGEAARPGHVQALLLLVLLDSGMGRWSSAWLTIGHAVRAMLHGINSIDEPQKDWLATLQGCFILDTLVARRLRKPAHLQSSHIKQTRLLDEDSHEEWEPWNALARDGSEFREPAFIVSCFNRTLELCMVLNDGVAGPSASDTAQQLVMQLQRFAESMSFPVMLVERRPPHHILLQLHYFATLIVTTGLLGESHPAACWKFLEVLELCDSLWNRPDALAIPALATILCHLVHSELPLAAEFFGMQSQAAFQQRFRQVTMRLSSIWPEFKVTDMEEQPNKQALAPTPARIRSNTTITSFPNIDTSLDTESTPLQSNPSNHWPGKRNHLNSAGRSDQMSISSSGHDGKVPVFGSSFDAQPQLESVPLDYGNMNIDIPEPSENFHFGIHPGSKSHSVGGVTTSPSFNGDEIDALFHEMAELDTTQWSLNRSQGLKDFGFQDDSTFEAFCNDPDRLMLSDTYMGPAFSNNVTHIDNQSAYSSSLNRQDRDPNAASETTAFDIFNNGWNG